MTETPEWDRMNARPRREVEALTQADLPGEAGVYAFYRAGKAVYVGKAKTLSGRLWKNHLGRGASMTNSALRRNVAESLGIAPANDIKTGLYRPTSEDAQLVTGTIRGLAIAWIECENEGEAILLEGRLKREWMPPAH